MRATALRTLVLELTLLVVLIAAAGCGSTTKRHAVQLAEVTVSADRRTLTVKTYYPVDLFCAKQPAGVAVQVRNDVAVVSAYVTEIRGPDCTAECSTTVQTVTLNEPLGEGLRFEAPPDALRGCGPSLS